MRSNARIYGWGRSRESIPGAAHWRWRFDEEAFSGRLWMFFLGGRGRGRGVPGRVLLRSFRRTAGSKQPLCMFILYVEQWRFRCSMSSGHRERGFFDPRTPWADACDVSGFNNSSTCSHSVTTVEGLLLLVPPGLHGVVGMMFMHMRSMLLYMSNDRGGVRFRLYVIYCAFV